jgi:hypothetical protein
MHRALTLCLIVACAAWSSGSAARARPRVTSPLAEQKIFEAPHFLDNQIQLCEFSTSDRYPYRPIMRHAIAFAGAECPIGRLSKRADGEPDRNGRRLPSLTLDSYPVVERRLQAGPCLPGKVSAAAKTVAFFSPSRSEGRPSYYGFEGESDAAQIVSVGASKTGPPIVAVLGASRATIWDFSGFPPGRLRGLVLVGLNGQAAANLPRGVELRFVTPGANDPACGNPNKLRGRDPAAEFKALVGQVLGPDASFVDDVDPAAISLESDAPPPAAIDDVPRSAISAAQPVVRDKVLPGIAGLARLFMDGVLRNATERDITALAAARERAGLPKVNLGPSGLYVVTAAITMPRGMYGGNLAKFLIAPNVPPPVDHGSHNTYYYLSDGRCEPAISCR